MAGLVGTGGVLVASGAAPAWAGAFCPGSTASPNVCARPTTAIVNRQFVQVVVWGPASTTIAVTECNPNLAGGDAAACDSNPADLNKVGGPKLATTNAAGKAVVQYRVRVSSTKPVGDGNCVAGGDTSGVPCFLVAAVVATQAPIANPVPFFTQ